MYFMLPFLKSLPFQIIVSSIRQTFLFSIFAHHASRDIRIIRKLPFIYIYTHIYKIDICIYKKEKKRRRNFSNSLSTSFHPRSRLLLESIRSFRLVSSRSPVATTSIEPPLPKPRNVASPRGSGTRQRDPRSLHRSETRRRADPLVPPPFTAAPPSPPSFIHHPAPSFPRSILSRLDIKRSR